MKRFVVKFQKGDLGIGRPVLANSLGEAIELVIKSYNINRIAEKQISLKDLTDANEVPYLYNVDSRVKQLEDLGLEGSIEWGWSHPRLTRAEDDAPITKVEWYQVTDFNNSDWNYLLEDIEEELEELEK